MKCSCLKSLNGFKSLKGELPDLQEAIDGLKGAVPSEIEWNESEKSKVINAAGSLQDTLVSTKDKLEKIRELLNEKRLSEAQAINWESVLTQLKDSLDTYRTVKAESGISKIKYTGDDENGERVVLDVTRTLHGPDSIIANLLDDFLQYAIEWCKRINQTNLNILGGAGTGKTHIACNICEHRLKSGLPALFIRGSRFTTDQPIEVQLRNILDIPPSYSWNDFLQVLSATAKGYQTRIPLIIDGLNESTHNGAFSGIWRLGLEGFVQEIAQTKNLVLITTCRSSYAEEIWGDKDPPNGVYACGFDTGEVEQAVKKYFKSYKITADLTVESLEQFKHPIHLKIFCEIINPTRETEKHINIDKYTLFEVFEKYLDQCNQAICKRLKRRSGMSIIQPELNKIAKYLWDNCTRYIPLDEFTCIVDGQSLTELDWLPSKTHAIEDEGILLIYRDWVDDTEVVSFSYDLLGGYLIAKYLIQQAADDMQGFLRSNETVAALFGGDYQTLHPMHEDICRCLAALLPAETGQFLHELSDNETAFELSICALFEIAPRYINDDCINLVTHLFEHRESRTSLLRLAGTTVGHPNHPFRASFWSDLLLVLSMPERDLSWTEYVRRNSESFEKKLMPFEETCQSNQELSKVSQERLHLLAEYIMWILTSTVRPLRDKATHALYWYGRRFPEKFLSLVEKSFAINDPYVLERMLAATYGIAMARQYDFEDTSFVNEMLPLYARRLYEMIFMSEAPHSTTHILARDYAKRTIDIALIHHSDLLTEDERKRITPPFTDGGIREWDQSERGGEGASPIRMDFKNYTLDRLVKYDSGPDERKRVKANVYWRIYDLGFSSENFGEIDKRIDAENWRHSRYNKDANKTDRYGKKYSWIAFYELAGFRQDRNLIPDYYDNLRISDIDIDPSFPVEQLEYNLVSADFLDQGISAEEWISKSSSPDLIPYLRVDTIYGEQGAWVLLQGSLRQKNDQINRDMSIFFQGLIVKPEESEEIVKTLKQQERIDGNTLPFCPEDCYTYAGEVPWCDTYPTNGWENWPFGASWIEVEQQEARAFKVLIPVRVNYWVDSSSAVVPGRSIATPSREIVEAFSLYGQPQSFDFFQKDGDRASITFRYGQKWGERQDFTYLREDLLERFLAKIDGELIWVIWGHRYLALQDTDTHGKPFQDVRVHNHIESED